VRGLKSVMRSWRGSVPDVGTALTSPKLCEGDVENPSADHAKH